MRSHLASSPLVRLLGDGAPDAPATGMDFAERLSLWLNAFDAIGLQAAHQSARALRAAVPARAAGAAADPAGDVQRVRAVLARKIQHEPPTVANDDTRPYAPFHDRHQDLQRQMDLMIGPLRAHLRELLERASPQLRQLAALDTALAQVLAPREQPLLASLPGLLKRRFDALRKAQAGEAGDWLDTFTREWREALLAELELRLAPAQGLAEALANESPNPR